jgi:phosphatidylglycerol:prolipoprotein diacylglycerol transferase
VHPILFNAGSFRLPTYGVLLALGLGAAIYTVVRLGRREGLDSGRLVDFSTWMILLGLIGAKVLMIISDWSFYRENPRQIFSWETLQAGGVFYGGFIAAVAFALWYTRAHRLPALKVFDIYAPAIALGQSIGRLGCFSAGDDFGKPTQAWWGVVFTNPYAHDIGGVPLGVRVHPTQLYESLATLMIFGVLLWRYGRKTRDGQIFVLYLGLYAVARFFIEFFRGDEDRGFVFNHLLSTSQFIALMAFLVAAGLAVKWHRRPREARQAARVLRDARRARS